MVNKKFALMLVFLVLSTSGTALTISPGKTELDYVPGKEYKIVFDVANRDGKPMDLVVNLSGDLANYANLSETRFFIDADGSHVVTAKLVMPTLDVPGEHSLGVRFAEVPTKKYGQTMITATVAIVARVITKIPYPYVYAEAKLETQKIKVGEIEYLRVELTSYGVNTIEQAGGYVDIIDKDGVEVARVPLTSARNILTKQKVNLLGEWDSTGSNAGIYKAIATVEYDGKNVTAAAAFQVGDILLNIIDLAPRTVPKDAISKLTAKVKSSWNDVIVGKVGLTIKDSTGKVVANLVSPTVEVKPWATADLEVYWDTTGLGIGSYDVEVVAYYNDKESRANFTASVTEAKEGEVKQVEVKDYFILVGLVLLLVILVLMVILALLIYRKRTKGG